MVHIDAAASRLGHLAHFSIDADHPVANKVTGSHSYDADPPHDWSLSAESGRIKKWPLAWDGE